VGANEQGEIKMAQDPLPAKVVDQLLEKLSSDDAFRALFTRSPTAALESLGFTPTARQVECCGTTRLADKETIKATQAEMRENLILGRLPHRPNNWDAEGGKDAGGN
jgi:putative modified peptide